nr:MAG TPA: hypothetical protein [Caudoviricetes sp.]
MVFCFSVLGIHCVVERDSICFPINSHYHYKLSRRTGLGQFWDNFSG